MKLQKLLLQRLSGIAEIRLAWGPGSVLKASASGCKEGHLLSFTSSTNGDKSKSTDAEIAVPDLLYCHGATTVHSQFFYSLHRRPCITSTAPDTSLSLWFCLAALPVLLNYSSSIMGIGESC